MSLLRLEFACISQSLASGRHRNSNFLFILNRMPVDVQGQAFFSVDALHDLMKFHNTVIFLVRGEGGQKATAQVMADFREQLATKSESVHPSLKDFYTLRSFITSDVVEAAVHFLAGDTKPLTTDEG